MHQASEGKKLVLVLASSTSMTSAKKAQEVILDRVAYICFPMQFQKNKGVTIWTLIKLGRRVNAMTPNYIKWLGF